MSTLSWHQNTNRLLLHLNKLRLGIILLSLALILFISYLIYNRPLPVHPFTLAWSPASRLTVTEVADEASGLRPGDIIVAVNGRPVQSGNLPLPLSTSFSEVSEITFRLAQGEEVKVPYREPGREELMQRLVFSLVALLTWGVSAPVILFATPFNKDAWLIGLVLIGLSLSLLAFGGFNENVPGTRQLFWLVTPISALGFAHLGFRTRFGLEDRLPLLLQYVLYGLYVAGAGVFLLAMIEIFFLFPAGSSIQLLLGFSLAETIVYFLALCLIMNPVALLLRYRALSMTYQQKQARFLMVFTLIAITPAVIDVLARDAIIPILPTIAMIALIPASYGYVVYRKDFLSLDVFMSRTIIWLLAAVLFVLVYLALAWVFLRVWRQDAMSPVISLIPISGAIAVTVGLLRPLRHLVGLLIFDSQQLFQFYLDRFTANLAISPQKETLIEVISQMAAQVFVRQVAYLLPLNGAMHLVHGVRTEPIEPLPLSLFNFSRPYLVHAQVNTPPLPIRSLLPEWVALVIPLVVRDKLVGVLFLGKPVPDSYFTGQQYEFLKKAANIIAISTETISLFESSLSMSLELQHIRDKERARVASELHDDPLQRITFLTTALNKIIVELEAQQLSQWAGQIRKTVAGLQEVARRLREICAGLNPPVLQQGAEWVVREVVYGFQQRNWADIRLHVKVPVELRLQEAQMFALYHILLESLNNIWKHAEAKTVQVSLTYTEGQLQLTVEDDGKGCNLESDRLANLIRNNHFGLAGMHTWARNVGGELTIVPKPVTHTGTIVQFKMPVSQPDAA